MLVVAQEGEVARALARPKHAALRAEAVLGTVRLGEGELDQLLQLARETVALERDDVVALAQEIDHRLGRVDRRDRRGRVGRCDRHDRRDRLGGEPERLQKAGHEVPAKDLGADHARKALRRLERALLVAERVLRVLEDVDVADGALLNCRGGGWQGA
eukprot:scaffold7565_cov80-Phaeocystis_antarctica.AAC.4